MRATLPLATVVCALALTAGCGGNHVASTQAAKPKPYGVIAAQRRMAMIVRAWSSRLNAGDNAGVARLFAVPAVLIQAPFVSRLTTRRQIADWYSGLPCSGHILSIRYHGRFAIAVFGLADRGAIKCTGVQKLAAARFEFVHGKIVSWAQVPIPPNQRPNDVPA